jgi:thioredoxin reductase
MVSHHSITADRAMRTSDPNIYAAGDRANAFHMEFLINFHDRKRGLHCQSRQNGALLWTKYHFQIQPLYHAVP